MSVLPFRRRKSSPKSSPNVTVCPCGKWAIGMIGAPGSHSSTTCPHCGATITHTVPDSQDA